MPSHLSRDQPKQSRMKAVRQRAQKLFEESGRVSGRDQENWLRAEAEIDAEACTCGKPAYVVIKFKGVTYTGEYDALATDYRPGELAGAPVEWKLESETMIITRSNGMQLTARIVKQEVL
jgi:hypothetical protein